MKTILLVDDEQELTNLLGDNLREQGYQVVTAEDGEEGLRKVQVTKPDLIVLDVMMPKMDGAQLYERLRSNLKTQTIPIIFLTALKTQINDFELGRDVGLFTIFSKPFDHDELLGTIREMTA